MSPATTEPHVAKARLRADCAPSQVVSKPPEEHELFYGKAKAPLIRVIPDEVWPGMWRVVLPGGSLSDLVNLARAKDAAAMICERGPPARDRKMFHWRKSTRPGSKQVPVSLIAVRAACLWSSLSQPLRSATVLMPYQMPRCREPLIPKSHVN
jgi:hypothetical protein